METAIVLEKDLNPGFCQETNSSPCIHGEEASFDDKQEEIVHLLQNLKEIFNHFFEDAKATISPDYLKWGSLCAASDAWHSVFYVTRGIMDKVKQSSMECDDSSQAVWNTVFRLLDEGNDQIQADYEQWKSGHGWIVQSPTQIDRLKAILLALKYANSMLSWFICDSLVKKDVLAINLTTKALERTVGAIGYTLDLWHDLLLQGEATHDMSEGSEDAHGLSQHTVTAQKA